jgi:hypothetical protein
MSVHRVLKVLKELKEYLQVLKEPLVKRELQDP